MYYGLPALDQINGNALVLVAGGDDPDFTKKKNNFFLSKYLLGFGAFFGRSPLG